MNILTTTIFSLIFVNQIWASEALIQVPEDCISNQESPCLVRASESAAAEWEKIKIQFSKNSVIQLDKRNTNINLEIKQGYFILQSAAKYKISGYEVATTRLQFVKKNKNEIYLLDSSNLDFKILSFEYQNNSNVADESKNRSSLVLQKSELLNREALVHFLSEFYSSKALLKKQLASLSKQYQNRLDADSKKQTEALQNYIHREIASEENVEKRRAAEHEKVLIERKRSRQLFFMRTFEQ